MQVDKLPKEIQEIALERHKEQRDRIAFTGSLSGVFTWSDTKEGHAFWYKIDLGNFDDFYKKYPKLIETKQYYTSIPKDVEVGDTFEVCYNQGLKGELLSDSSFSKLGDIVTLEFNDNSVCPKFKFENNKTAYVDWGWLKPVESKSSTKKSDLLPVGTIVRISAKGKREYSNSSSNPHDKTGEITEVKATSYVYKVKWKSGSTNAYCKDEIEEVVNDKSNNYGFNVGDEVWYTDDAISILKKSQEHNTKYVITAITKGHDTLGVVVEMKSDAGNVSINTYWLQKKENSSINKLNIQQNGSKSSSTIISSSKCTGSESIALHGISASIICGTTPRGEIVSCSRAEIKLGN